MDDTDFAVSKAQTVLHVLDNNHNWSLQSNESPHGAVPTRIGESRAHPARSRYVSEVTDGYLDLTIPDPTGAVARITLTNALDPTLTENSGRFVTALGVTHSQIGAEYCKKHFEPLSSPDLIAKGHIPTDFDNESLDEELNQIHKASMDVDALHERIWAPLASPTAS